MLNIDYPPGYLPKTEQIAVYKFPPEEVDEEDEFILNMIEGKSRVICCIPCSNGMVLVVRESEEGEANYPFTLIEK
jgi:hypothetical protein